MTHQMDGITDGKRVKGQNYVHLSTLDDYPDYLFIYNFYTKHMLLVLI